MNVCIRRLSIIIYLNVVLDSSSDVGVEVRTAAESGEGALKSTVGILWVYITFLFK